MDVRRVHACEAVVALARSNTVGGAQRCQLTPLIKRLLTHRQRDPLKAAEAVHALAKNFRGQALRASDIECHLARKRQRKRRYEASFTSAGYHRGRYGRIHYNIGLWQTYANKFLPPDGLPLVDWNVRAWLDDGGGMIDDSVLEGTRTRRRR